MPRREPFESISLELTNHCNFNCLFCPNRAMTRLRGQMDPGLAKRLLEEIADRALCQWVNLSLMGEPLLHPQVLSIAEHGVRLGIPIHVITNLSLLTPDRTRRLLDLPIAHLAMSLQTPNTEDFALKEAPASCSLEQNLEAIERAVRIKLESASPTEITIHLLTTRLERPRGKALLESTRERLAIARRFRERARSWASEVELTVPARSPLWEPLRFWLGLDGFVPLLPGVALCFKRATLWANTLLIEGADVEPRLAGTCQLALDTLGILWDGRLTMCCMDFDGRLSFGNVSDRSITEALRSDAYLSLRSSFEAGRLTRHFCQRCRGRVAGRAAKELVPGALPVLVGEGWKYLSRFQLRKTLRRVPQEFARYLKR
jgi:organic radical activating enzyme